MSPRGGGNGGGAHHVSAVPAHGDGHMTGAGARGGHMTRRRRRLTSRGSPAHGAHGLAAPRRSPGAAPVLRSGRRGAPRLLPGPVQVGGRWDAMGQLEKGCSGGYGEGGGVSRCRVPLLPSTGAQAPGLGSAGPVARFGKGQAGDLRGKRRPCPPGREAEVGPWRTRSRAGSLEGRLRIRCPPGPLCLDRCRYRKSAGGRMSRLGSVQVACGRSSLKSTVLLVWKGCRLRVGFLLKVSPCAIQ